jgi:phosphoribosylformylglycinamidine (FGAM) synthase PurS component
MSRHLVAIRLKIPDNEAYTALTALRRLGVEVAGIERSDIYRVEDNGSPSSVARRVESDESIFNPNKHTLTVLESDRPRDGETWIEELGAQGRRYVAWRLFNAAGEPAAPTVVRAAVEALLCNPAIERSI